MKHLYYNSHYDLLALGVPKETLIHCEEQYIKYVLTNEWVLIDDKFEDNPPVCPVVAIANDRLYFLDSNGRINEVERNY